MKLFKTIPSFKQGTLLFCGVVVALLVVFSGPIQEGIKAQISKQTCEQSCPLNVREAKKDVDKSKEKSKEKKAGFSGIFPTILTPDWEESSNVLALGSRVLNKIVSVVLVGSSL